MINKRSNNLCDVYILPLVNLNPTSFGVGNFVNSYIDTTDHYVIVKLKQTVPVIRMNANYRFEFVQDEHQFLAFQLPDQYKSTIRLFREGKYSLFPEEVKILIRQRSGLTYKLPRRDGKSITARELLVLDKDKALKKVMEEELSNKGSPVRLDDDAELGSIPGEENFLELNLSAQLTC